MKRAGLKLGVFVLALLVAAPALAQSQPTEAPVIRAGSPEDNALRVVENESDSDKRLGLLDQFLKDFPALTQSPEVNALYVLTYQQLKNNGKVIEYAEKVVAVRANDLDMLPILINALLEQPDQYDKAYTYAKRYLDLAKNPENASIAKTLSDTDRTRIQAEAKALHDAARQQKEYAMIKAAYQETNNEKKITALDNFTKEFSDSPQVCNVYSLLAVTYLQGRNVSKATESTQKCLKINPNHLDSLVLLGDLQIEDRAKSKDNAEVLSKAVNLADALESRPVPEGQNETDWAKRKNYLRGTAHGLRGYLDLKNAQYAKALPDLQLAHKLLGDDSATLYRLGFALAKLKRAREAETYLTRAANMPGPFQRAAKDALAQLNR